MYKGVVRYCGCAQFVPDWDATICAICKMKKPTKTTSDYSVSSTPNASFYSTSGNGAYSENYSYNQAPTTYSSSGQKTSRTKKIRTKSTNFITSVINKIKTTPVNSPMNYHTPTSVLYVNHNLEELDKLINELNDTLISIGKKPMTMDEKVELRLALKELMATNPELLRAAFEQIAPSIINSKSSSVSVGSYNVNPNSFIDTTYPSRSNSSSYSNDNSYSEYNYPSSKRNRNRSIIDDFTNSYSHTYSDYGNLGDVKNEPDHFSSTPAYVPSEIVYDNNNHVDVNQNKIEKLKKKLKSEREEKKTLQVEVFNLKFQHGFNQPGFDSTNYAERISMQNEIDKLTKKLEVMKESQKNSNYMTHEEYLREINELKNLLALKDEEIRNLTILNQDLSFNNKQLESQIKSLKRQLNRFEQEKENYLPFRLKIQLEELLNQQRLDFTQQMNELQLKLNHEILLKNSIIAENEKLKEENKQAIIRNGIESANLTIKNLEDSNFKLNDRIIQYEIEIKQLKIKFDEISIQQSENIELNAKLELKNKLMNDSNEQTIDQLRSQITQLNTDKKIFVNTKNGLESTIDMLTQMNSQLKEQVDSLLVRSKSSKNSSLNRSNSNVNNNNNNNNSVHNENREVYILRDKLANYEKDFINLNVQLKDVENQKKCIELENVKMNEEFQQLRKLISFIGEERERLKIKIKTRNDHIEELTQHYSQLIINIENQIYFHKQKVIEATENMKSLEYKVEEKNAEIGPLKLEILHLQNKIEQLELYIKELQNSIILLQHKHKEELESLLQLIRQYDESIRKIQSIYFPDQPLLSFTQLYDKYKINNDDNKNQMQPNGIGQSNELESNDDIPPPRPSYPAPSDDDLLPSKPPVVHEILYDPLSYHLRPTPIVPKEEIENSLLAEIKRVKNNLNEVPIEVRQPSETRCLLLDQIRAGTFLRPVGSRIPHNSHQKETPSKSPVQGTFDPNNIIHILLKAMINRDDNGEVEEEMEEGDDAYDDY